MPKPRLYFLHLNINAFLNEILNEIPICLDKTSVNIVKSIYNVAVRMAGGKTT